MSILQGKKLTKVEHPNPVHQDSNGKWFFWDETCSDKLGPFDSEKKANEYLIKYCDEVLKYGGAER